MRSKSLSILLIVCVLGALGYLTHRVWGRAGGAGQGAGTAGDIRMEPTSGAFKPHRTPSPGQQEFYDEQYRFSILYPNNLAVQTYSEGGGATTISFQNIAAAEGFQIFIMPYAEAQVSAERFRQDEPSGVRQSPLDIQIDGALGSSFYGSNQALGDTAEVWFIKGGFLYEVTAPKSKAQWFSNIMTTWQFI